MTDADASASTPSWLTEDQLRSQSGLEIMRRILAGELPHPPIAEVLGYRLATVEDGFVAFEGIARPELTNPMGTMHGGWYATLLDSAMACAVMTRVPQGNIYTTLEYDVKLMRAFPLNETARAEGTVTHAGRKAAFADGRLIGPKGRVYATASTTCIIL